MAKKVTIKKKASATVAKIAPFVLPPIDGKGWLFVKDFRFQALIVVLIGVLFYANTYKNQYALDDDIIMKKNMYVQKGFSGLWEVVSNDAYKSYYESMGVEQQLSGGRYRPLSVITFAIEQAVFGKCYGQEYMDARDSLADFRQRRTNDAAANNNTAVERDDKIINNLVLEQNDLDKKIAQTNFDIAPERHAMQVFWFVLSMVVLLYLLRTYFFRSNTDIAFLTVLLFIIHPIHTEVIANVKSRDEIFSLLFICLTFIFFFRYDLKKKRKDIIWGMFCFWLAFLSKEYAVALIVLIPAALMIFNKRKLTNLSWMITPFIGVLVAYAICRFGSVGLASAPVDQGKQDILNDPYLIANSEQRVASKINRLDDYLWLLIWPWPLVSDYSYATFPYSKITDPGVWLSIAVYAGLVVLLYKLWVKRHPMAFAMLIYFAFFAMICNIFFDIGATMGERLIYHSSLGFCMAVAWLLVKGLEKIKIPQSYVLTGIFILISIPAFMVTTKRNAQWKNDFTLFTVDADVHPNSALTNGNAGSQYMNYSLSYLGHDTIIGKDTILKYGRDTVKVHRYADTASVYLLRATQTHKKYVNGFLNLGLTYYYREHYDLAADAWGHAYQYFPSNGILLQYQQMLVGQANIRASKKDYLGAAKFMGYAAMAMPGDPKAWSDYGGASFMAEDFPSAIEAFKQAMYVIEQKIPPQQKAGNTAIVTDLQNQERQMQGGLRAAMHNQYCINAWKKDTMNADSTIILANAYMGTPDFYPKAKRLLNQSLQIRPNDKRALFLLDSLSGLEARQKLLQTPPPPTK
jgi:tetratricopeptide (TPR) repeat protein